MRYLIILAFSALLFTACSGSKEIEMGTVSQDPCRNEGTITNDNPFAAETAENFQVYQQGDWIYASMDLRAYCNSRIVFSSTNTENEIRLNFRNAGPATSDCVCVSKVTTQLKNIPKGTYTVLLMKEGTNMLLAETQLTVN